MHGLVLAWFGRLRHAFIEAASSGAAVFVPRPHRYFFFEDLRAKERSRIPPSSPRSRTTSRPVARSRITTRAAASASSAETRLSPAAGLMVRFVIAHEF